MTVVVVNTVKFRGSERLGKICTVPSVGTTTPFRAAPLKLQMHRYGTYTSTGNRYSSVPTGLQFASIGSAYREDHLWMRTTSCHSKTSQSSSDEDGDGLFLNQTSEVREVVDGETACFRPNPFHSAER